MRSISAALSSGLPGFPASLSDRLSTAIWVYDFDFSKIVWANASALKVWNADSFAELNARDLSTDMSPNVKARLGQYREDFSDPAQSVSELWTIYPRGEPATLNVLFRGVTLDDGRLAMLCEGTVDQATEPDSVRSVQALLHTPVQISLFSANGDVLYQNPAARDIKAGQDLGLAARFCSRSQGEKFLNDLKANHTNKTVAQVNSNTGDRWYEISASRVLDSVTGTEAYLVSELDVTESKEAEGRAERADRAKSEFLANMSHELRTPLNAIIGFSDFMMTGSLAGSVPEKYVEYTADIHESGQHLLTLINDILDLAKVETGEMPMHLDRVCLTEIFGTLERIMAADAQKEDVTLTLTRPSEEIAVTADMLRVKQILMNLLSNALKFTDPGGTVSVQAERRGDQIAVIVCDTGIGMTASEIEESLKPFRQVDNSISRRFGGTGLGLPLSKSLAESQGGSLEIVSVPERGTEVTVLFPPHP